MVGKIIIFKSRYMVFMIMFFLNTFALIAQNQGKIYSDSVSIDECLKFAMKNQPAVEQLKLAEEIANQNIRISLSDWLPQINSNAGYQYFLKQPVSIFPDLADLTSPKIQITTGVKNNSNIQFSANQNIFNNDLYFAGRTARFYRQ